MTMLAITAVSDRNSGRQSDLLASMIEFLSISSAVLSDIYNNLLTQIICKLAVFSIIKDIDNRIR